MPAGLAAQVMLLTELSERHEAAAGGDASWLDPVLSALGRTEGAVRTEFLRVLDALRESELSGEERQRLGATVPAGVRLEDPLSEVSGTDARVAVLIGMLRLLAELAAA